MVPIPEYFPSLDKCLNGDEILISWKTAFYAILNKDTSQAIQHFFSDQAVRELLSHPFNSFPPPSQQSKAAFETKTSAINVTPSSSARYDIKEVKEDALWLSKEAQIDEISALRITVEECQTRAIVQLVGPLSNDELTGIQDAAGNSQSSVPVGLLSQGADAEEIQKFFHSQDTRRARLLRLYLSERLFLIKCVDYAVQDYVYGALLESGNLNGKDKEDSLSPIEQLGLHLFMQLSGSGDWLLDCIGAIEVIMDNLWGGSGWYKDENGRADLELEWFNAQIAEATEIMEIMFQVIDARDDFSSSTAVLRWLRLINSRQFFQINSDELSTQALVLHLQTITAIVSVSILSVGPVVQNLQPDRPVAASKDNDHCYIVNTATILEIQNLVVDIAEPLLTIAGPLALSWSIILQTLRLRVLHFNAIRELEEESGNNQLMPANDIYEETIRHIVEAATEDPIQRLALSAIDGCHVFETLADLALRLGSKSGGHFSGILGARMRMVILDLIRSSSDAGYIPEVISATLSTLTGGQNYWDLLDTPSSLRNELDTAAEFLQSDDLMSDLFGPAKSRYPFESLPFLKMVRSLASSTSSYGEESTRSIIPFVEQIPSFTYILPDGFSAYETTQEEENNNSIRLTRPVQLFESRGKIRGTQARSLALVQVDPDFCIASGTYGRMVSDTNPKIAVWFHEYSGFKYFGKLLETFLAVGDQIDGTTGDTADRDSVTEIVAIFAVILLGISKSTDINTTTNANGSKEEALRILEVASSGLNRNRDVTTVIFDIFEEELQRQSITSGSDVPLDLLVSCVQFIHALTLVMPSRVWPLVGRSGLLSLGQGGGKLSSIVGGVELVSGRYDLLISCTRLYEGLVDDFATHAVARRSTARAPTRFSNGQEELGSRIPGQVHSTVLLSFTRYFVDVLESSCTWKFVELDDCRRIRKNITGTFEKILRYTFSLNNTSPNGSETTARNPLSKSITSKQPEAKMQTPRMMAPLEAAAFHITDSFLSTSSGMLRIQPLMRAYYDGFDTSDSAFYVEESQLCVSQVVAVLAFSKTLLRVGTLLEKPTSQLESQLFKASPLIARLYAVNDAYRVPVVALFEALIIQASNGTTEPPSLLGHLCPLTSKNFLQILSDLDKPLSRDTHLLSTLRFYSKVVSGRQQWFANHLLTGKTSKDARKSKASGKELATLDKPPLITTLESFTSIENMPQPEALEKLEFIALAQNFWPWATYDSQKHADFIHSISQYLGRLQPLQPSTTLQGQMVSVYQTRIAARIAEILAMHLFHSRQTGRSPITTEFIGNLDYFTRWGVGVPQYNSSLHGNLKINFERQYTGCKLLDLQRTSLEDRELGPDYFYNLELADKMLSFDRAWKGRGGGFSSEVAAANVNLSLVDAQIALLHGWKFLAVELSTDLSDQGLQRTLATVATDCLSSNRRSQGSEEIFTRLCQSRADLALVLVQRLVQKNSTVPEMYGLLGAVWETIRASNLTFEMALGSGDPTYYRSLLKLLFVGLRVHSHNYQGQNPQADLRASTRLERSAIVPTILEILDRVVARGLRDVVAFIHDNPTESSPEDLAIITGILQLCIRVPGIDLSYDQIVSLFVQNDSSRIATTLFSWSDTLAIGGDPIYGELSILFLLELSAVPAMAEQLGVDGVLAQISAANLTSYLRGGNVSPFAEGAGIQRCYSIWVKGILPLVLNLLDSIGHSIATEVSLFLNQFLSLLKQSSEAFDAPETSRTASQSKLRYITLNTCAEVHTTSMIIHILNGFREENSRFEMMEVKWDAAAVLENVEFWLATRALFRERLLPMGDRDIALSKKKSVITVVQEAKNQLEEKAVLELMGIRDVLGTDSLAMSTTN